MAEEATALLPTKDGGEASASTTPVPIQQRWGRRWGIGIAQLLAVGACAVATVASEVLISSWADTCGTTSLDLGYVFLTRAMGALVGAIVTVKVYGVVDAAPVMSASMMVLALALTSIPFIQVVWGLHLAYAVLGLSIGAAEVGLVIMIRYVHGPNSLFWLSLARISAALFSTCVPGLVYAMSDDSTGAMLVFAMWAAVNALLLLAGGSVEEGTPDAPKKLLADYHDSRRSAIAPSWRHFPVELLGGLIIFLLVGAKEGVTAYLPSFTSDTEPDPYVVLVAFYAAITVSSLLGWLDQAVMYQSSWWMLSHHLAFLCVGATVSLLVELSLSRSVPALWIGMSGLGFFIGSAPGYVQALVGRLTPPSEIGELTVLAGGYKGAGVVPWLVALAWNASGDDMCMLYVLLACTLVPLPLLYGLVTLGGAAEAQENVEGDEEPPVPEKPQEAATEAAEEGLAEAKVTDEGEGGTGT